MPPNRSPLVVIEAIKNVIKGRTVCELGCASGDLMVEMQKYAKKVVGVENRADHAQAARNRGLDVETADIFKKEIPEAEVYYIWINKYLVPGIKGILRKGIWIIGADSGEGEDVAIDELGLAGEWKDVYFSEGDQPRQSGVFKLFLTIVE